MNKAKELIPEYYHAVVIAPFRVCVLPFWYETTTETSPGSNEPFQAPILCICKINIWTSTV